MRVDSEYSDCNDATGWTACAARSDVGEISEKPNPEIFPDLTKLAKVCVTSSIGTDGSRR